MILSNLAANYSNTRVTEHASGRISYNYSASSAGRNIFGVVKNGQIVKNRVMSQQGFQTFWASNFINTSPTGDVLIQNVTDQSNNAIGLEFFRLHDSDTSSLCTVVDNATSRIC